MYKLVKGLLLHCVLSGAAVSFLQADVGDIGKNLTGTWQYVDFDTAMQREQFPMALSRTHDLVGIDGEQLLTFFKELYERNADFLPDDQPRIPKIIHHIWLGSPVPQALKSYMHTWQFFHPDWVYLLWTDEEAQAFGLFNQELYDIETNYGAKSDILRYEILHRFGGVYTDVDFECLQPLDVLHHTYDFYTGLIPLDAHFVHVGIGIIGAVPGHPILAHCIETMKKNYYAEKGAPAKTGPIHFTRSCFFCAGKLAKRDIIFPASFFYPFGSQAIYEDDGGASRIDKDRWVADGAFAVHWWGKTWMPKSYRPLQFRQIDNGSSVKNWDQ